MIQIQASIGYVKDTGTRKGLGVFASRRIVQGEVVEACPVLILDIAKFHMPDVIATRVFAWGQLTGTGVTSASALALGWGSMYNHANPANLRYVAEQTSSLLLFFAVRDIEEDEELTINYNSTGGDVESNSDNWFEGRNVHPV